MQRILRDLVLVLVLILPAHGFSQAFRLTALAANQTIDWNGWDVSVDSFDSSDPNWSIAGLYDPTRTRNNGDVIVGGSITDSIGIATANIYGHVQVGVGGGVTLGAPGGIGERSWQTNHPGQVEPGWLAQGRFLTPADVTIPYLSGLEPMPGNVVVTNCTTGDNCTLYTNSYDHVLFGGDYFATSLRGRTIVLGTSRLVMPDGLNMVGSDEITVAASASVVVYAGTNSTIGGSGIINQSGLARAFQFFCTPGANTLNIDLIGGFAGVVVAPEAVARLNGAGTNTNQFVGALVAQSVQLNGNLNFHFDESLVAPRIQLGAASWSNQQFLFSVVGGLGSKCIVQTSTNLSDWIPLATNAASFSFTDSSVTNFSRRFYRAVSVP